jgi:hypothetical protein
VPFSEYEPLFSRGDEGPDDLTPVRERFAAASRPFLSSPFTWFAWAVLLPLVSLATPALLRRFGPSGTLIVWSLAILAGGAVELVNIRRSPRRSERGTLASWVLSVQGNLSLVALSLSLLLVWLDLARVLPALWLLLLGHSFYMLGGLAFSPMKVCGLIYQAGGAAALWPELDPFVVFAVASGLGNLWMGVGVWRATRQPGRSPSR